MAELPTHLPEPARERLRLLASDDPDPHAGVETPGRDAQYELFLYGELRRAGLSVNFAEPDLIVSADDRHVAIAAKRPKNNRQLVKRFREAAYPLERIQAVRVVAISLDLVLAPDVLPKGATAIAVREEALRRIKEWNRDHAHRLVSVTKKGKVDAVLFTYAMPAMEVRAVTWLRALHFSVNPAASREVRAAIEFIKQAIRSQPDITVV